MESNLVAKSFEKMYVSDPEAKAIFERGLSKVYELNFLMQMKLLGITNMDFDVIGQRLIRYSISVRYWRKSGSIMAQYINYL
jgi:hypothetical protein